MKSIKNRAVIFLTVLLLTVFSTNTASAQPPHAKAYGKHKYYYYPASNVYYDAGPKLYYYNAGSSWKGVSVLPPGISMLKGAPRHIVYYNTPEVWNDNHLHAVKYKTQKNKTYKADKNKPMNHKEGMKHKENKKNGKNN